MNNKKEKPQEIYEYDGSAQSNKQELKKLKGKAQSFLLIYSLIILFFLFVGIKSFLQISDLETIYNNQIPESELREVFRKPLARNVYDAVGKWGFTGMFIGLSVVVYFARIRGSIRNIKEYNRLLNQ